MEPWTRLDPELHALAARTAAMEGYLLLQWICRVLEAGCDGRNHQPSVTAPERVKIENIPDALKRRCEQRADDAGVSIAEWATQAIRRNCWSKEHLDAVADAL
mgnify:FL=1